MALFGTITICFLIAMAFSKDCGCNNECEAAQKVRAYPLMRSVHGDGGIGGKSRRAKICIMLTGGI
jgi:hypothetical protein